MLDEALVFGGVCAGFTCGVASAEAAGVESECLQPLYAGVQEAAMNFSERDIGRFFDKVAVGAGCWEWTAGLAASGYGQFSMGGRSGRPYPAHRVSWMIHRGFIPDGMLVCHHCDNRRCVNPEHLFLGTHKDNMDDMYGKGRDKTRAKPRKPRKLTNTQVLAIREDGRLLREIAGEYGVSMALISQIKKGQRRQYL